MSSMSPWTLLELDEDADERSIKRQYAKRLKVTRPDDDPGAFQALREAYEQALRCARMRADEQEYERADESESGESEAFKPAPEALADFVVKPAPDAEGLAREAGNELARLTDTHNLQTQHELAMAQGCDPQFQQRLLERCLRDDSSNASLLNAAIAHLRWLTPWQTLRMSAEHEHTLTHRLLELERTQLEWDLANGEERHFLSDLQALSRQPWLASLERRQQLQSWLVVVLHNNPDWTAALFDRICTLFSWDDRKGIYPEPEFIWRGLIARCEENAYAEHLQRLVDGNADTVEAKAAVLVLAPPSKVKRLRLARSCGNDVWIGCETLCNQLKHRHPDILESFPEADLEGWRSLQVPPFNPDRWMWIGWCLFTAFYVLPSQAAEGKLDVLGAAVLMLIYPLVMVLVCNLFMRAWRPVSLAIERADEWLSDLILPEWIHWPGSQALAMRHGVPLILTGWITAHVGLGAFACYSLLMLAWIFLSPYRHPQVYAPARQAIKAFIEPRRGQIFTGFVVVSILVVLGFFMPAHTPILASIVRESPTLSDALPDKSPEAPSEQHPVKQQ